MEVEALPSAKLLLIPIYLLFGVASLSTVATFFELIGMLAMFIIFMLCIAAMFFIIWVDA